MFDVETYLITKDTLSAPIIRHVEPQVSHAYNVDADGSDSSLGNLVGQAISLLLILGGLLYFYVAR